MDFLLWLENTRLALFIRESTSILAWPTFLFLHSLGLSIVVGISSCVALRVLGLARSIPLRPLRRFFAWMWLGFAINTVSGAGLVIANASSELTNPVFLTKMTFVFLAVATMWLLEKRVFPVQGKAESTPHSGKGLAWLLLVFWMGAVISGRLIAYISIEA